ncbi:MAG: redox-regulated ATPase YchF [Limnochordia bacterium]
MKIGLIGLPQVGKSTLFRLLTDGAHAASRGKAGIGVANIPDGRIDKLTELYEPKKTIYATLELVDIEGFTPGEGTSRFLSAVQDVDALVQVVRAFTEPGVAKLLPDGDAADELLALQEELALVDWTLMENRLTRLEKERKKAAPREEELALLARVRDALEEGIHLRTMEFTEDEAKLLQGYSFYTAKPLIIVVNVDDDQLQSGDYPGRDRILRWAEEQGVILLPVAVQMEWEIAQLPPDDREVFMADLGLDSTGVARLARAVYQQLGLISFFTVGKDEVRAWTIKAGTSAKRAAGKIHSDIERGFIRAEVISYTELVELGSMAKAREEGRLRLEGKDYIVQDGDVINFRFNV